METKIYSNFIFGPITGFLSYLWGMETQRFNNQQTGRISSYPTYEEWKPPVLHGEGTYVLGSYPTYEEWKLNVI